MQDGSWKLDLVIVEVKVVWSDKVSRGVPVGWMYEFGKYRSKWSHRTSNEAKEAAFDVVKGKILEALEAVGF